MRRLVLLTLELLLKLFALSSCRPFCLNDNIDSFWSVPLPPDGDSCTYRNGQIFCYVSYADTAGCTVSLLNSLNYTLNVVKTANEPDIELSVDCNGGKLVSEEDEDDLVNDLLETGLNSLSLNLSNCDFSGISGQDKAPLLPVSLSPLYPIITQLSITCSLVTSYNLLPQFDNFTALESYTFNANKYYPMGYNEVDLENCQEGNVLVKDLDRLDKLMRKPHSFMFENAIPCSVFYDQNTTFDGKCLCTATGGVYCFYVSESHLLSVLHSLDAGHYRVQTVTIYELTYNIKWTKNFKLLNPRSSALMETRIAFLQGNRFPQQTRNVSIIKCHDAADHTETDSAVHEHVGIESFVYMLCPPFRTSIYPVFDQVTYVEIADCSYTSRNLSDATPPTSSVTASFIFNGNFLDTLNPETVQNLLYNTLPVTTLDLRHNRIKTIAEDAFSMLSELQYLDLSYNLLQTINPAWWDPSRLPQLTYLGLTANPVRALNSHAFGFVGTLTRLVINSWDMLDFNNDGAVRPDAFVGLANLTVLEMRNVPFSEHNVPAYLFAQLQSLQKLDLTGSRVAATVQINLPTLRRLTFDPSTWYGEPCTYFANMPLLDHLTFGGSPVCNQKNLQFYEILRQNIDAGLWNIAQDATCGTKAGSANSLISVTQFLSQTNFSTTMIVPRSVSEHEFYDIMRLRSMGNKDDPPESYTERNAQIVGAIGAIIVGMLCVVPCIIVTRNDLLAEIRRQSMLPQVDPDSKKKKIITNFFSTTTFNGFSYIQNTRSKYEKIAWYIIFLICMGFLIHDCANLYMQYSHGDPNTGINLPINETYRQTPFTLCVPIEPLNPTINLTSDDAARIFSNNACNQEGPFGSALGLRVLLQHVGFQMFIESGEHDRTDIDRSVSWLLPPDVVAGHIKANGWSNKDVLQMASAKVCEIMQIKGSVRGLGRRCRECDYTTVMSPSQCAYIFRNYNLFGITWYDEWGSKKMCLRFPGIFSYNASRLEARMEFMQWQNSPSTTFTWDADGYDFSTTMERNGEMMEANMFAATSYDFTLMSVVQKLEFDRAKVRKCYPDCVAFTRIQEIAQNCICKPVMWANQTGDSNLRQCTLEQVQGCKGTDWPAICAGKAQCLQYEHAIVQVESIPTNNEWTVINLVMRNRVYKQFTEQEQLSLSAFISNLGGVLGVWVGATFMGIIHAFSYFIRAVKLFFYNRKIRKALTGVSLRRLRINNGMTPAVQVGGIVMHDIPSEVMFSSPP